MKTHVLGGGGYEDYRGKDGIRNYRKQLKLTDNVVA
jgi:hypothetical protein